ncbi:hypothetical protein EDD11_002206 [Mortierella claussenii]|nr:hypothetical protein EDD11_002206 [Mortierella claussenii]
MIDQSKGEYISSWLKQQGLQDADDNYEDNIEYEELSYLVVDDTVQSVDDLDHRHHYDDQHGLQFQHLQQNCSELIPINASQSICHRRTFSMMNPDTFTSSCSSALQQHKQEHRHLYQTHDLDYNPDLQLHQYRIQHYPYIDQHVQIHSAGYHRRYMSVPMNFTRVDPSLYAYGPPIRPAHELAWERHNYYKRLQYEEERMVLRMHQQKLEQQCQRQQYSSAASSTSPSRLSRHCPQDPVARTGSLNRLAASPSLLSADTSRVLGLCRSNTLSKTCKRKSTVKKESAATTAVVASSAFRGSPKKTDHDAIEKDMITETIFDSVYYDTAPFSVKPTSSETTTTMTTTVPSTSLSLGRLGRKKTLKEHLTPPLRSLARRCSTRFGGGSHGSANGSGSRPKSFSGARSDPIVECPQGRRSLGSRSGAMASAMMIGGSGHMCDFKPLQAGPETTEMLKQNQLQQEAAATATTTTGQGSPHVDKNASDVPVHRKVTLLRSKTTRASSPAFKASFEEAGRMVARTETLPYGNNKDNKVNKNNSLRLANGRGLNFSTSVAPPNYIEQQLHGMTMDGGYLSTEAETEADDTLEHESMRKQIVAILSLGRKDLRRRSSSSAGRSRNASTPALSSPSTSSSSSSTSSTCPSSSFSSMHCLSPLAVEAQEDLYPVQEHEQEHAEQLVAKEDEMGIEQEKPFDKSGSLTAGHSEMQEDPCEKIVFMLVPKSRYEFQPLVVR